MHFAGFASALIYTSIVWKLWSVFTYWLCESYGFFCVIELQNNNSESFSTEKCMKETDDWSRTTQVWCTKAFLPETLTVWMSNEGVLKER